MKLIKFLLLGVVFGIVLTKGQVISWFRIQEMFRFESFHMYGVIGTAVMTGALFLMLARNFKWKSFSGEPIQGILYENSWKRYLFGGTLFGLGWAMTGACPGPLFILTGAGYTVFIIAIASAILGTIVFALIRKKLPV